MKSLLLFPLIITTSLLHRAEPCCLTTQPETSGATFCVTHWFTGFVDCYSGEPLDLNDGDTISGTWPQTVCSNQVQVVGNVTFLCPCENPTSRNVQNLELVANSYGRTWIVTNVDCLHCNFQLIGGPSILCGQQQ